MNGLLTLTEIFKRNNFAVGEFYTGVFIFGERFTVSLDEIIKLIVIKRAPRFKIVSYSRAPRARFKVNSVIITDTDIFK